MANNDKIVNENSLNNHKQFPFPIRQNSINDDYTLSKTSLGEGISGKVYQCEHRQTGQKRALKILLDTDLNRRQILMHKKACKNCPYIVQIIDIYQNRQKGKKCLLIVMENMEGGELFTRIQERSERPYTERDAARFISMIVQAVAHLHKMDMAHRDLKPENLLFTSNDDNAILKLTDFGFAKQGNNEALPLATPCFTAYYVAPEILSSVKYDKSCDIWALGVIVYILLCGYPPFYPKHDQSDLTPGMRYRIETGRYEFIEKDWAGISEEAKSMVQRMLIVDPTERITIDEILQSSWLSEFVSDRSIDMSSISDSENWNQIQIELSSANADFRQIADDVPLPVIRPETSRIVKKRQARQDNQEK